MTSESRRRIAAVLTGTVAMLTALLVASMVRERACTGAGGQWLPTRVCEMPPGSALDPATPWAWVAGLAAGVAVAVAMWRTYAFFLSGMARRAAGRR